MRSRDRRALRSVPALKPRERITKRDLDALATLAWAGVLTTQQVARAGFPSIRVAQRRLRALLDYGLIASTLQGDSRHRDNLHVVSRKGRELLRDKSLFAEGVPRSGFPRPGKCAHVLALRDVFVDLLNAERSGAFRIVDMKFDRDLSRLDPFRRHGLIPDLLLEVETGGLRRAVGIEVDLGTEPFRVLESKVARWRLVLASGDVNELLVIATSARRRARLAAHTHEDTISVVDADEARLRFLRGAQGVFRAIS